MTHRFLGEILKDKGLINDKQLEVALEKQKENGQLLGQVLIDLEFVKEEDVLKSLGEQTNMPSVNLNELEISRDAIDRVSASIARIYKIMPISWSDNTLTVAMADPMNVYTLDDLRFMLGCELKGAVSTEEAVNKAIERYYGAEMESMGDLLEQIGQEGAITEIEEEEGGADVQQLQELAEQVPVVKLLNLVLMEAIKNRASDIHFEPFEDQFKIRYRVDGTLYEMVPPPKHLSLALTSRIKVMSNLDIAERRLPQAGRIQLNMGGREVDLRISTLPTVFGESVVMRVLDRSVVMLALDQVGMQADDLSRFEQLIRKPNGIILGTGPTGCGKTTTLYSALKVLNSPDVKIITTEDPVEYNIPGIMQVQIKEAIDLTFAKCLRHILRQDPDIILVGEIRDLETAEIAIQASLTGHLVLSTLHTNDAPSTVTRLIDMDIEPFMLTSTVEAVLAQRLVRTICQNCKEPYQPDERELQEIGLSVEETADKTFYRGRGCDLCDKRGYKGRTGIFELLIINEDIRVLIIEKAPAKDIRVKAMEHGMRTMRDDGLEKVYHGITTIEEIVKGTQLFA
ncbi:type II secretion system ATPase GspE [bacterium]|nr:type II secretion system ATPase GspE [bacterium]MCK4436428.1 type II secretion system ATPase GspE [bacterium]